LIVKQHYTVKQVSEKLNLSLSTLRNYIRDGVIQVKQIPGTKTIRIAERNKKKYWRWYLEKLVISTISQLTKI